MTANEKTSQEIWADPTSFQTCGKCKGSGDWVARTTGRVGTCDACKGSGRNFTYAAKKAFKAAKEREAAAGFEELKPLVEKMEAAAEKLPKLPTEADFTAADGYVDEYALDDAFRRMTFQQRQEADSRAFLESLVWQARNKGKLSEKQCAAAEKLLVKLAAPAAPKVPVETGKAVTVTGTVKSVKEVPNAYAYNSYTEKMVVEDDRGFRVYGTLPSSVKVKDPDGYRCEWDDEGNTYNWRHLREGDRVTFVASVEASKDDASFGFFKRPRKGKAL